MTTRRQDTIDAAVHAAVLIAVFLIGFVIAKAIS